MWAANRYICANRGMRKRQGTGALQNLADHVRKREQDEEEDQIKSEDDFQNEIWRLGSRRGRGSMDL